MSSRNREYIDFLKQRFDETKFIEFVSDLLNLSSEDINSLIAEQKPEQKQFRDTIEYYKYVSNYSSNSDRIGTFIVKLTSEGSQNARTAQRTFISTLLNKYNLDASLVAFYQDNELSWRLSFVKKELNFTDKGIKVDLTPAKRFSYLVGENESVHTAQEYLFSLLNIEDRKITLSDIEKVFDVEKVTKRFFEEYKEKYLELKEFLDNNQDFITESENCDFTSEEFAKKLMGQIVFLYFLQKKGWLGVQIVPDKLTEQEYKEISNKVDSVCNNLLEKYYFKNGNEYIIDKQLLKNESIKDNINNFLTIFKGTKYDKAWGTGDKKFVRNMFIKSRLDHKDNFFDEYLEPFFYTGLNEKRDNQYFALFNCKIPFLNGGLFEPLNNYRWSSAQFNIPDEMFSNDKKTGILDIFDLYNFTIDEEEPLEKDIAVDPEMLGKIFENLLDVKDRKSTGSFYTPREIVHYMCQESLANYIVNKVNIPYEDIILFIKYGDIITQTDWNNIYNGNDRHLLPNSIWNKIIEIDKALLNIKVADPAVGSGAFPLGILNEIVRLRDNISSYILIQDDKNMISRDSIPNEQRVRDNYSMKLQTIQNSIYAVDIEISAVDIAKLRLWLSLIVDFPDNQEPKPLPNLDCKIMQGNSLLDEYEGVPLFSERLFKNSQRKNAARVEIQQNVFGEIRDVIIQQSLDLGDESNIDSYFDNMMRLQREFFSASDPKMKKDLKNKIDNIQIGMVEKSLNMKQDKLEKFKEISKKKSKPWFIWKLEFFDVFKNNGGFDIVIGNPPYIQLQKDNGKLADELQPMHYETFTRNGDIYCLFYEKGLTLLNQGGTETLITSNKWLRTAYGKLLRRYLAKNSNPVLLINFGDIKVFDSAQVDVNILLVEKSSNKQKTKTCLVKNDLNNLSEYVSNNSIYNSYSNDDNWILTSSCESSIKSKIEKKGIKIKDSGLEINRGVVTGFNDAFFLSEEEVNYLSKNEPQIMEFIHPTIRGRDVDAYFVHDKKLYLLFIPWHFPLHNDSSINGASEKAEKAFKEKYPLTYQRVFKYKNDLSKRNQSETGIRYEWYCLQRWGSKYWNKFSEKKIMYSEIVQYPRFYLDDGSYYSEATTFFMTGNNLESLICILNSSFMFWVFKKFYAGGGLGESGVRYKKAFFENLPIPQKINNEYMECIYKKIINKEISIKQADQLINAELYRYFELTEEEVSFVENNI